MSHLLQRTLKPVTVSCCTVQALFWYLLSGTLDVNFDIFEKMHEMAGESVEESLDSFQTKLAVFCKRLANASEGHLIAHLSFVRAAKKTRAAMALHWPWICAILACIWSCNMRRSMACRTLRGWSLSTLRYWWNKWTPISGTYPVELKTKPRSV